MGGGDGTLSSKAITFLFSSYFFALSTVSETIRILPSSLGAIA